MSNKFFKEFNRAYRCKIKICSQNDHATMFSLEHNRRSNFTPRRAETSSDMRSAQLRFVFGESSLPSSPRITTLPHKPFCGYIVLHNMSTLPRLLCSHSQSIDTLEEIQDFFAPRSACSTGGLSQSQSETTGIVDETQDYRPTRGESRDNCKLIR